VVLEVAVLNIKPGRSAEFEAAFIQAQVIITGCAGYQWHELRRCIEMQDRYLLLVRWDSLEAHVHGFRSSPAYQEWRRLLHHFYDPFPMVEHYERVGGACV
jgi:heme-degrading monooxygenase HmoA